jgi:hypothetical protein
MGIRNRPTSPHIKPPSELLFNALVAKLVRDQSSWLRGHREKVCSDRKELVRRQRQVADTLSSSIEHSIGDGGSDSSNADFADAARAHG